MRKREFLGCYCKSSAVNKTRWSYRSVFSRHQTYLIYINACNVLVPLLLTTHFNFSQFFCTSMNVQCNRGADLCCAVKIRLWNAWVVNFKEQKNSCRIQQWIELITWVFRPQQIGAVCCFWIKRRGHESRKVSKWRKLFNCRCCTLRTLTWGQPRSRRPPRWRPCTSAEPRWPSSALPSSRTTSSSRAFKIGAITPKWPTNFFSCCF